VKKLNVYNDRLAEIITSGVATMWCAYAFAALALVSLPDAIKAGRPQVISWIAQTFLQLVLLSIIMVGQRVISDNHDALHAKVDGLVDSHGQLHAKVDGLLEDK
jgi:hypothetical protein